MFSDICGKMKAVTFSYDDAVEQDIRLIAPTSVAEEYVAYLTDILAGYAHG